MAECTLHMSILALKAATNMTLRDERRQRRTKAISKIYSLYNDTEIFKLVFTFAKK